MRKKYFTDEERKKAQKEALKQWRSENPNYWKKYYEAHRAKLYDYLKNYNNTQRGRAVYLCNRYKAIDKQLNRGKCTLTSKWIVDNIFTKSCHYCGETDWHKLGCDRINNDLPHTPDNVVPCCGECNKKRNITNFEEFKKRNGE